MVMMKIADIQQSDILRLEAEMNNLWGELNTSVIPHSVRMELEEKLSGCEENFKAVLGGQASMQELDENLHQCNSTLAFAAIQQAKNEIPKAEHNMSCFQALEHVWHQLTTGSITPVQARHRVKEIMRHHT